MKYAVVTYIFGKNKEILRDPKFIDKDVDYVCVTDQKDLKSDVWRIVYDEIPEVEWIRDKMVVVKYDPFEFTDADRVCVIDGSLEIVNSLIPLFKSSEDKDLLVKRHPVRNNLTSELEAWFNIRGMSRSSIDKFKRFAKNKKVDLNNEFLIESCVLVYKNTPFTKELGEEVLNDMSFLGDEGRFFLSNQCVLSLVLQTQKVDIGFIEQDKYFLKYRHNSKMKIQK